MSAAGREGGGRPDPQAEATGPLADPAGLRRIELLAVAWTGVAVAALLVAVGGDGAGLAVAAVAVLTGVSAVSIVAFRGLQRIVSGMGAAGPREDRGRGPERSPDRSRNERRHRTIGWRQGLAALVRLGLLGALVVGGSLLLGPRLAPALVLGFSTLPAALMTEGLLQIVRALRGKEDDGFS